MSMRPTRCSSSADATRKRVADLLGALPSPGRPDARARPSRRRPRARSAARAAFRPAPARSPARRPSRAARPPRAWRPPPDPRPVAPMPARQRRIGHARGCRRGRRRRSRAATASTFLARAMLLGDALAARPAPIPARGPSRPARPRTAGRCGPARRPGTARAPRSPASPWACCSRGTTGRPRRPAGPGRCAPPRGRAPRSGRRRPADRWCSRTARACRGPRPCRRWSAGARPGRPRGSPWRQPDSRPRRRRAGKGRGAWSGHREHHCNPAPCLAIPRPTPALCA